MKNYKDNVKSLGYSDIASLIVRLPHAIKELNFGEDGSYSAYLIDESIEVPAHYIKVIEANTWCSIYDDETRVARFVADKINIYRAGDTGCIIQLIGQKNQCL